MTTNETLSEQAKLLAFVGNSLLAPMRTTKGPGLDPAFWAALSDFGSAEVEEALQGLFEFAVQAQESMADGVDVATEVSCEFTKLFVGPPSPAAAPWETYYPEIPEGVEVPAVSCGYGQATFAMRELLQQSGLALGGEHNQFEDHIGIELLYASALLERAAQGEEGALEQVKGFVEEHPARWIGQLMAAVEAVYPQGYILRLLKLAKALLALRA